MFNSMTLTYMMLHTYHSSVAFKSFVLQWYSILKLKVIFCSKSFYFRSHLDLLNCDCIHKKHRGIRPFYTELNDSDWFMLTARSVGWKARREASRDVPRLILFTE